MVAVICISCKEEEPRVTVCMHNDKDGDGYKNFTHCVEMNESTLSAMGEGG